MTTGGDFGNPLRKFKLVFLGEQSGKWPGALSRLLPRSPIRLASCKITAAKGAFARGAPGSLRQVPGKPRPLRARRQGRAECARLLPKPCARGLAVPEPVSFQAGEDEPGSGPTLLRQLFRRWGAASPLSLGCRVGCDVASAWERASGELEAGLLAKAARQGETGIDRSLRVGSHRSASLRL